MKKTFRTIGIVAISCMQLTVAHAQADMDRFIDQLMGRMTVEEKIGQLNLLPGGDVTTGGKVQTQLGRDIEAGRVGAVLNVMGQDKIRNIQEMAVKKSRLGIPLIIGLDVIHGYETVFPLPLAQSCSWDIAAIERGAAIAAQEASADGINWVYSPMVDIALDPRWGRMAEGAGEDPFLGSRVAEALVYGYQGRNFDPKGIMPSDKVLACLKHFALYGAVEAGRDYSTVDMSHLRMYNQYFPPYKAAVKAGVGTIMTAFNLVDGQHATANPWLLRNVLRQEWGFDGMIVTDYGSIGEMPIHGLGDEASSAVKALKAGTDMDMCSNAFTKHLAKALQEGRISMADIDAACRRVLVAKWQMGLFKDPYRHLDKKRMQKQIYTAEHLQAARDFTPETFVLLRNEGQLLPLKKQGKIALIGPLANDRMNLSGTWAFSAKGERNKTVKEALEEAVKGQAEILYAQGSNVFYDEALQKAGEWGHHIARGNDEQMRQEALDIARQADVIVCAMGETAEMSGESSSRSNLHMPDAQFDLLKALVATGKPVVLLNFSGRSTVMSWESKNVPAIMNVWYGGSETGDAIADVLFGDREPSGKLTVTMPQNEGQIPIYYNSLRTGRDAPDDAPRYMMYQSNYLDVRNAPLYPFGYGLSYTSYSYGAPQVDSKSMNLKDGKVTLTVNVKNTGLRDGDEIVQFYIHDPAAQISRPKKELKGFQRIHLKAGESRDVQFEVTPDLLQYYNNDLQLVLDPGEMQLMVGPNSRDVQTVKIQITE